MQKNKNEIFKGPYIDIQIKHYSYHISTGHYFVLLNWNCLSDAVNAKQRLPFSKISVRTKIIFQTLKPVCFKSRSNTNQQVSMNCLQYLWLA